MRLNIFKAALCALLFAITAYTADAQDKSTEMAATAQISCINTAPGEDASTQMRISWAANNNDTYLLYTHSGDRRWRHAKKVLPQQQEQCTVFDGRSSKKADGTVFNESARFVKCGAQINALEPDTEYKYVICKDPMRGVARKDFEDMMNDVHTFKTAGAEEWSCCIISDFHSYTPLPARLESAMNMLSQVEKHDGSIDWVLHLGDICAWGGSYSFWERMYKESAFKRYMWAGVNGNHDNMSRTYELSNQYFRNMTYAPENGYEGEMGVCYHFRYGNALFIMLNNESMRSDDGLLAAQKWVKSVVESARKGDNKPDFIIVCEHYQWFNGIDGKTSQYERWYELFDELGVDLALAGNNHIYVRSASLFNGKVVSSSTCGTVYLQTSSSDNERGQGMNDTLSFNRNYIEYRFTEGGRTISALDMKVNTKGISISLLDRNGTVLDSSFIPVKKNRVFKTDIRGNYMRDSLDVVAQRCSKSLKAAYMAGKLLSTNDSIPGWEGYPVQLWEYYTGVDVKAGVQKRGLVYMLNPDARKLARWIINAVYDVKGEISYEDVEKVRKYITWQSGTQFPVSGVVFEDMYVKGEYYPYLFKDGVTVYVADEAKWKSANAHPTDEQLEFYTTMTHDDLAVNTGRFARICSTTREMYYKAGGTNEVGRSDDGQRSKAWLTTVRELYKKAWKSDRNFLIYAWALSNL